MRKINELMISHNIDIGRPIAVLGRDDEAEQIKLWKHTFDVLCETLGQPDQFAHRWNWYSDEYGYIILDECYKDPSKTISVILLRVVDLYVDLAIKSYNDTKHSLAWNILLPRGENANTDTVQKVDINDLFNSGTLYTYTGTIPPIFLDTREKQVILRQIAEANMKRNLLIQRLMECDYVTRT